MPRPRPPSRVEPLNFPVFGMAWWAYPGGDRAGTHFLAYCGGGGSARTGVHNNLVLRENNMGPLVISTGDKAGMAVHMYLNPLTQQAWMVVALGHDIQRYRLPAGTLDGTLSLPGDTLGNALAVNAMADRLAVGCEHGEILVYAMTDEDGQSHPLFSPTLPEGQGHPRPSPPPLYVCQGHTGAVCAVAFSLRGGRLVSSAKDGTARVWKEDTMMAVLTCDVIDPKAPPPAKNNSAANRVLVRGCAFADLQGQCVLTVASPRRGKAYLARWREGPSPQHGTKFVCEERTECSPCPISAMSLSQDGGLLALGAVNGTIILFAVENWKKLKEFPEVHDLPVTCIAARPFALPLQGEEDGVQIHARSASADSQLGCLTLQTRVPKQKMLPSPARASSRGGGAGQTATTLLRTIYFFLLVWILSPIVRDARRKCHQHQGLEAFRQCVMEDVLIAPPSRPGILSPPY